MPTDRADDPWSDSTYNGFAGAPAAPPPPRRRIGLPAMTGRNVAIGAAAAVAFGLVFGLWARPNFAKDPSAAAERTATPVPIQIQTPPPQPLHSDGKLEVLSPDQVAAARMTPPAVSYAPAPPPALPAIDAQARAPAEPEPAPPPAVRQTPPLAVAPPRIAQSPPAPMARAGFDCSDARSAAEAMVCGDPELAAADREMARAYRRALQSGAAPRGAIRADQRDWLAIREEAARHSRRALASVYQQRIDELNAAAQDGDGPGF